MAVKFIPYYPDPVDGQALLDNFVRTKRILRYRDADRVEERIARGMPLYETKLVEQIGKNSNGNLVLRGECLSACAYLKNKGIQVDLVYIDPPFASGADYAKTVYLRRNPKVAEAIRTAESELEIEELRSFEEKMYGDIWDKERYLNWMYENLCAIKSVMSENASIYVHLDWHIGPYVKILLDEVFGEENFQREIIWDIQVLSGFKTIASNWIRGHDTIYYYSKSADRIFNKLMQPHTTEYLASFNKIDKDGRYYMVAHGKTRYRDEVENKGKPFGDVWSDIKSFQQQPTAAEKTNYATQKPESLLERIIKASSNEGMVVADFFGGSGVTAAVSNRLGRRFIHNDIGINSIQVTRDRLKKTAAEFEIREIQDGVSLYRNPVQTMDKLKSLIPGLCNEDTVDKFWEGYFNDPKYGKVPVYLPNLMDGTTRILDCVQMNRIINEAMPDLPEDTQKVIVFYIEIEDMDEIQRFIHEQNNTLVQIELRDLKSILDEVVVEDEISVSVNEAQDGLLSSWRITIDNFYSDRLKRKIDELNEKGRLQILQQQGKGRKKTFQEITVSDSGLELIEWLSVDSDSADKESPWHSTNEIFIDKTGFVIEDGIPTNKLWDGSISCATVPRRLKVRNICGDETIVVLPLLKDAAKA